MDTLELEHVCIAVRQPPPQVRNAMDRARMNSAIRVFNSAVMAEGDGGFVSEKVSEVAEYFSV